MRLDPTRLDFAHPPTLVGRGSPRGPIDSLILHLLALLVILGWPAQAPPDIEPPIPVTLVIEQPPPPQPAEPQSPPKTVPGRHASDDFAPVAKPKPQKGAGDAAPSAGEPQSPAAEAQNASAPPAPPSPEPGQPKEAPSVEPRPATAETQVAVVPPPPSPPKPASSTTPAAVRPPKRLGSEWPLPLSSDHAQSPVQSARLVGPAAVRDEYCARLLHLTMHNIGLLPLSETGERHGMTSVEFRVLGDGTLNSVRVVHSSGYPEIDEKIAQMVLAVGRFPPLPKYMPGEWMDFTFDLHFPHPLQR